MHLNEAFQHNSSANMEGSSKKMQGQPAKKAEPASALEHKISGKELLWSITHMQTPIPGIFFNTNTAIGLFTLW